ncbi:MAG: beta-lactamase family protein [Anaerolineae bacterium]|nr:beta-lactamase family protein [Anaerolineae bacterium]
METIKNILHNAVGTVTPAAQLVVRWRGEVMLDESVGWLDPETRRRPTQPDTLFDMASVTKLFVVTTFMRLVEAGLVALEQPVCTVLPEFSGPRPIQPYEDPVNWGQYVTVMQVGKPAPHTVNTSEIVFRQLLTHTAGLPAWRPLYKQFDADAARQMALATFFACPPNTFVVYSDIGLILLGLAIESLIQTALNTAVATHVTTPLNLHHTCYLPLSPAPAPPCSSALTSNSSLPTPDSNIAPTEHCTWRNRRIVGEVHDENAYRLGGVAGHAGLFSTAGDIAAFGQLYLDGGPPLLHPSTVAEMTRLHTEGLGTRRGLGFLLWSPDPEASSHPFSQRAFGHTGFTGTSLWMDPERDLVVALLTNEVYNGRQNRGIGELRVNVHQAIIDWHRRET